MENVERFILKPSMQLFGGVEVKEDTEFETWNNSKTVHQTFKDGVLTTDLENEWTQYGISNKEKSHLESTVPVGTILIWDEDNGYIIPQYQMQRATDACEVLKDFLEGVLEDDARRTETCNPEVN